jgi:hypothetical protein
MAKQSGNLWQSDNNRNTSANYLCEDRAEPESKAQGGVEPSHTTIENNAGKKGFFLVVCSKKY